MTSFVESISLLSTWQGLQRAVALTMLVGCIAMAGVAFAQEQSETTAGDGPADTTQQQTPSDPLEPFTDTGPGTADPEFPGDEPETEEPLGEQVGEEALEGEETALDGVLLLALVIALFVVPMLLGTYLGKVFRMPDHGWKFAISIGTLLAAAVVIYQGEIKYGPDLSGGITLIYELQDTALTADEQAEDLEEAQTASARSQTIDQLIGALTERVDPSGTKEVTIREYGSGQIEIIIPKASQQELEFIERRIYTAGALEFRITASPVFNENRQIIERALELPPGENAVYMGGNKVAEWMSYRLEDFGPVDEDVPYLVKRMAGNTPQALILTNDGLNVTGEFLESARSGFDEQGRPQVEFNFNAQGAFRFGRLTGSHTPNASGQEYHLGIILDKRLLSAPSIESKITSNGRITGSMGKEEVDFIVGILNAGSLPASLNKDPISRETISPTLGAETVEKGRTAILYSLIAVMVFMLFYYRFAGFVACFALAANLLLILGLMVLFKAAFTLPGLAGLVLTIGMSVDANVLIFERIREERNRGAALRMAIRNGFAKAMSTIVDANVTTLITAVVIYKIAPDNVKGFGVTLIIGIVMSMYSAIFLSRLIFDVAEKTRRISELKMVELIRNTRFDFLSKKAFGAVGSLILIVIGVVSVYNRGADLLNIDFTGGSSVTMVLDEDQRMDFSEVKEMLATTPLNEMNLTLVEVGDTNTRYTVSSVEEDVNRVQEILKETFGERLKTYHVQTSQLEPIARTTVVPGPDSPEVQPVNLQVEQPSGETQAPPAESAAPAEGEAETPAPGESGAETPTQGDGDSGAEQPPAEEATLPGDAPAEAESADSRPRSSDRFAGGTRAVLNFSTGEADTGGGIGYESVRQLVEDALAATDHTGVAFEVTNDEYQPGSARRFVEWEVKMALPQEEAQQVLDHLASVTNSQPVFPLANKIGGRVAGDLTTKAIAAVIICLIGIVAYIWFRFQRVEYGLAAVIALIHDVLITLGVISLTGTVAESLPQLADALMLENFQISLPLVAAFLTIIGYSLNDTIVVFDRIREVKGKSPNVTAEIINNSINQTLGRTFLTSITTLLSVILLYVLGGDGIHGFAFALVIGVLVGTYSSIFVASPVLLWMSTRGHRSASPAEARAA